MNITTYIPYQTRNMRNLFATCIFTSLISCGLGQATPAPPPPAGPQPIPDEKKIIEDTIARHQAELERRLASIGTAKAVDAALEINAETQEAASKAGMSGMFKVSTDLKSISTIPPTVLDNIEKQKRFIRQIFTETAREIESGKSPKLTYDSKNGIQKMSEAQAKQATDLKEGIDNNTISLKSLSLAINGYIDASKALYDGAIKEHDKERKFQKYVQYTALVYELSNVVIDTLSTFEVGGVDEIRRTYDARISSVNSIKAEIQQRREVSKKQLNGEDLKKDLAKYDDWVAALDGGIEKWAGILATVDKQKQLAKDARSNIARLQKVRDDAHLQLKILEEVGILQQTVDYLNDLDDISMKVGSIPLLPIDSSTVNELIGIGSAENAAKKR